MNHPLVASMGRQRIEEFLAIYDDRPTTKVHIKTVLRMLLDYAVDLKWMPENPATKIKVTAPEAKVAIWEAEDVEIYAAACIDAGRWSVAAMIRMQWETGQRLTDARLFRYGAEYSDNMGEFSFRQSKTDSAVTIPISDRLRGLLKDCRTDDSLYLFTNEATGGPWDEVELPQAFAYVRQTRVTDKGGTHRLLRVLRHSCVVQMARAGCTIPEIAAITGHSPASVHTIIKKYLPRDSQVARNAQAKRGLIQNTSRTEV